MAPIHTSKLVKPFHGDTRRNSTYSSEQRDSQAALVVIPNIRDGPARERQWRRCEETAKEPTNKEGLNVICYGAGNVEDYDGVIRQGLR